MTTLLVDDDADGDALSCPVCFHPFVPFRDGDHGECGGTRSTAVTAAVNAASTTIVTRPTTTTTRRPWTRLPSLRPTRPLTRPPGSTRTPAGAHDNALYCENGHALCVACVRQIARPAVRCGGECSGLGFVCPLCRVPACISNFHMLVLVKGSWGVAFGEFPCRRTRRLWNARRECDGGVGGELCTPIDPWRREEEEDQEDDLADVEDTHEESTASTEDEETHEETHEGV